MMCMILNESVDFYECRFGAKSSTKKAMKHILVIVTAQDNFEVGEWPRITKILVQYLTARWDLQ